MLQACHLAGEDETHQKGNYFFNITEATTLKCPIIAYQVWDSMLGLSVCKCRRAPARGGGGGGYYASCNGMGRKKG